VAEPFPVLRGRTILAVADVVRSRAFYVDRLGFEVAAAYDDPPYLSLTRGDFHLSLAEQGHAAEDRPGVTMTAPADPSRLQAVLVLEVEDCAAAFERLRGDGVRFLTTPYSPPWGGSRAFAVDPDGYLVEIEQLA
jgi:catechol 2,3-dioxygenase-like lactoylglutathione lyase family enzyme